MMKDKYSRNNDNQIGHGNTCIHDLCEISFIETRLKTKYCDALQKIYCRYNSVWILSRQTNRKDVLLWSLHFTIRHDHGLQMKSKEANT